GDLITGHVTGVHLQSNEIVPTGFSPATGPVSVSYSADLPSYPCNATLNTQVWEGTTPADRTLFERIAIGSSFAHWLGTPYTTRITKTGFPAAGTAKLQMSANATWVAATGGRSQIYMERIADNRLVGEVLRTRYLSNDPGLNLDYFEADSPRGLSTFGLSALSGSGNPLQLITLTVTSHVEPPSPNPAPASTDSDSDSGGGGKGAGAVTTAVALPAPATTQAQPVMTAVPTPAVTDVMTFPPTLAAAKIPVPLPATQQPQASPPTSAVSIFINMIALIVTTIGSNAVVVSVVAVAGLAVYLFTRG
ncbi:MAG: alanine and proline-rich secreted protein Apa, partial [Methanoregula sp.]|nr:alanine and proline-rich secreted protein Apa [Methanoregula sp.]